MVLKENRMLIKEFKMRGNYEMKKGGEVNAFNLIEAVEEDGAGGQGATSTSRISTCSLMISKRMSR